MKEPMEEYLFEGRTIEAHLFELARMGNKPFTQRLHPGVEGVLGIRVPMLRALAGRIAAGDWEAYLGRVGDRYMEERMLHGLVLGKIPVAGVEDYLARVARFVPKINSWSVCDVFEFSGKRRFVQANREMVWRFVEGYMRAHGEYEVRFGVVMAMKYFLSEETLPLLFDCFGRADRNAFYARMAVAWALSVCCVADARATLAYIASGRLDRSTRDMTLRKIVESRRVDKAVKEAARSIRRQCGLPQNQANVPHGT